MHSARTARRTVAAAVIAAVSLGGAASTALADPPHGEGGHTHHVDTGNGACIDIDSVAFHKDDRGLHRGADSSGTERGLWHGACG